jgi:processive 1,2-diacylglycerol beta-glucosyltransferase
MTSHTLHDLAAVHADEQSEPAGRIVIVSAGVGAGHDGAARQLQARLVDLGYRVRVVDFLDLLPGTVGRLLRGAYRFQLRTVPRTWEWVLAAAANESGLATVAARLARLAEPGVLDAVGAQTSAVVSTYPLASQTLGRLRVAGRIRSPVITYLTDMSVHPLWVSEGVDAHLALNAVPAEQARRLGAAHVTVTRPTVSRSFRPRSGVEEQQDARRRFGLPPTGKLALVTTGSWGVGEVEKSAHDIDTTGLATPVIACGGNHALRARLEAAGVGIPLGWVNDMATLMLACDVVIQNAGGLTCLEALSSGLPVISYRCLPGHGRTNAAALEQAGWCPWPLDTRQLAEVLAIALSQPLSTPQDRTAPENAGVVIHRLARTSTTPATSEPAVSVSA